MLEERRAGGRQGFIFQRCRESIQERTGRSLWIGIAQCGEIAFRELDASPRRASPNERCCAQSSHDGRRHYEESSLPAEREGGDRADPEEGVPPRPLSGCLPDDRREDSGDASRGGTGPCWETAIAPEHNTSRASTGEQHRNRRQKERDLPDQPERCA